MLLANEANEIVVSRSPDVELFPDALEVLAQLKAAGKHLALITTSERRMIVSVLEKYKIVNLFETIITDDDVERAERKPHPKPLLMAHKPTYVISEFRDLLRVVDGTHVQVKN